MTTRFSPRTATCGTCREPGQGKFGVDVDHDFAPDYVVPDDRRKQVADIEKAARSALDVWLATDLDREGEAIAWHVRRLPTSPPPRPIA